MQKTLSVAAFVVASTLCANAEMETHYDITGEWAGEGFVQRNEAARKIRVRCKVAGEEADGTLAFAGTCRAMLIMKREIGVTLTREGDTYTGTYIGSDVGPAALSGTRTEADRLVLKMTFPRGVNGDDIATMTINHTDPDAFSITTVDLMESGADVTTASITFARKGEPIKKAETRR